MSTLREAIVRGLRAPSDAAAPVNVVGSIEDRYAPAVEAEVERWIARHLHGVQPAVLTVPTVGQVAAPWPQEKVGAMLIALSEAADEARDANTTGEILLRIRLHDGRFMVATITADKRVA